MSDVNIENNHVTVNDNMIKEDFEENWQKWDEYDTFLEIDSKTVDIEKECLFNNALKNAGVLINFPFETFDGETSFDNEDFNSVKRFYKNANNTNSDGALKISLTSFSKMTLCKLVASQFIGTVNGIISIGKESIILHADTMSNRMTSNEYVLKVFDPILREDEDQTLSKKNAYRLVQKEKKILIKLDKAGVPCPRVVGDKNHILIMSFIGKNKIPAPKLKNASMSIEDYNGAYKQVIKSIKQAFEGNIVHGNLSENNILWHQNKCYFMEVSQSLHSNDKYAHHFLYCDCQVITKFFEKMGVTCITAEDLFISVTGYMYNKI